MCQKFEIHARRDVFTSLSIFQSSIVYVKTFPDSFTVVLADERIECYYFLSNTVCIKIDDIQRKNLEQNVRLLFEKWVIVARVACQNCLRDNPFQ